MMYLKDVKKGAIVRCLTAYDNNEAIEGKLGKVVDSCPRNRPGIQFRENIGGHELNGRLKCPAGRGWYIPVEYLRLVRSAPAKTRKS